MQQFDNNNNNVSGYDVNFDGLIDLEDFLENVILEIEHFDLKVNNLVSAVFKEEAMPARTLNSRARDIGSSRGGR